jgi:hypothetical protein
MAGIGLILSCVVLFGSDFVMASDVTDVTKDAASPGFNYYGRWHRGKVVATINSGAFVEFSDTGRECSLNCLNWGR